FVHGLGAQTAEGVAEWLHYEVRRMLDIPITQGRRYSWGYPAVPDQSEHLKVDRLLDLSRIGMRITDGYAPDPEQSTLALVAHHPQAIYFGTRQGRLLPNGSPDDLIRGRAAAEAQRRLEALGPELARVERPAQLVQRRDVLLTHALARGLEQDQVARAAELGGHAHERLALRRFEPVRGQHDRLARLEALAHGRLQQLLRARRQLLLGDASGQQ